MKRRALVLALPLACAVSCHTRAPSVEDAHGSFSQAVSCPASPAVSRNRGQLAAWQTTHGSLAAGQADRYGLRLGPGDYVRLLADQSQVDLVLCLYGPERALRVALDSPNGQQEPEELLWWARQPGDYTLVVSSLGTGERPRSYDLRFTEVPHPSARDQARLAAVLATAEGEELRRGDAPAGWRSARDRYLAALARWERLGDRFRQADMLARLGRLYRDRLDDAHQALLCYERARFLFNQIGASRRSALAMAALGRTSMALGRLDPALSYQRQALALFTELRDPREQAVALNEIGYLSELRGDWQAALDGYARALQLWSSVEDRAGRAVTVNNRGLLYSSLGEYRLALDDFEQARRLRSGRPRDIAATLSAMGNTYGLAGQPVEGLALLREALALRVAAHDAHGEAVTQSALGIALRKVGRRAEAIDWHERALSTFVRLGDADEIARAQQNLGASLREAGRLREAVTVLTSALDGARRAADEEAVAASLLALAETRSDQGEALAALPLVREALQSVEAQRVRSPGPGLRSAFLATKQNLYDFAVELLMELDRRFPARGFRTEALDVSERARARSLLDELRESGVAAREGLPPDLAAERRRLEAAVGLTDALLQRARSGDPSTESPQVLARRLRALLRDLDRLTARIHARVPEYRALAEAEPLTAEGMQHRVLDSATLLLHYKLGAQHSYLWVVTPTSLDTFVLPARRVLDPLARRAQRLLAAPQDEVSHGQTQVTLRRLSDALLAPVARLLGNKRLLVVGDDALQLLPFAALPRPESGARSLPLMTAHEIVSMPSASALSLLASQHEGREPGPRPLAVLADPVFSPDDPRVGARSPQGPAGRPLRAEASQYGRLRHAREEAQAIVALAPRHDVLVALDFAASRDLVLSGALAQYRILHFTTHGEIDPDHAELSRLVLSLVDERGRPKDGFLYAHEIFGLKLPAELVVLSGCETGLGKEVRGEGLVGLPQAFLHAGAARLVVSLWKVDDRSTARLFESFYRHLFQRHESPSQALRHAQIERWRQEPRSYNWAAFISLGRWR
ncbi:MAG TPA: CHAT domain-containing tetratricopeptide repeat protein [Thermoanaerobaculia bacterium]|nr:CHAT domain-containing tetratricopeptide repeat protein [Thermoanaerobaculia bacterium]